MFLSSHILSEVEQICDRVVIIDRGHLVRTGPMGELLATGTRVELTVDNLTADGERIAAERGAAIQREQNHARLVFDAALKREMTELLWRAGCDIISMNPVKSTLEDVFLKLVSDHEGAV